MTTFTFTEKAWDNARPSSVTKTGLGDAIKKFLKVVPGADTAGLKTASDCVKAQEALVSLSKVMVTTQTAVQKASDDKKGAGKLLKTWVGECEDGEKDIKERKIALVEAVTAPALKKWLPMRKELEKKVMEVTERVKAADNNAGHAEQMIEQATMSLVLRAEALRETGHAGVAPKDFLDDKEFKTDYEVFDDMVDTMIASSKTLVDAKAASGQLKGFILTMYKEMKEAAEQAGDHVNLPSDALRNFKALNTDVEEFWTHTCSDRATKYATFAWIPDPVAPHQVRPQQEKQLANRFVKVKKVDAESYYERALSKYALNDRQLKKTIATVQQLSAAAGTLIKSIREAKEDPNKDVSPLLTKLKQLQVALDGNLKKHRMGRTEGDIVQALSRPENAKAKEFIDKALNYFEKSFEVVDDAVKELA